MAEILPDGTMQGYYNICKNCGKTIEVNMHGTPLNHKCEGKNLDIPHVIYPLLFYTWLIDHGNPDLSIAENLKNWNNGNEA